MSNKSLLNVLFFTVFTLVIMCCMLFTVSCGRYGKLKMEPRKQNTQTQDNDTEMNILNDDIYKSNELLLSDDGFNF